MVQSTIKGPLTDVDRPIEAEMRNSPQVQNRTADAPPRVSPPATAMPDYVEHRDGATEIGRLSAEAVVREYEIAAKEIEAVGAELADLVKQCEAMTRHSLAVTDELKETAGRYREEAKRVFVQIENCSQVTAEVRKTCTELREKIAAPAVQTKAEPK
jgi:hypothetical protein